MRYLNYRKSITYESLKVRASHWLSTPKDDGVFAHAEGGRIVSREGVGFPGFDEIVKECSRVCALGGFTFLQGELFDERQTFQDIQGLVRSSTVPPEQKRSISLRVFNAGGNFKTTRQMFHQIRRAVKHALCIKVEVVECELITDREVSAALYNAVEAGHEGIVLRHLKIYADRHTGFVKLKPYRECDLTVTAIHEGQGERRGTAGAITVSGKVDGEAVRFKVAIADKKMRRWFWNNEASAIVGGLIVEIKHGGLNSWPREDGTYALRDAVFIKTKEDRRK